MVASGSKKNDVKKAEEVAAFERAGAMLGECWKLLDCVGEAPDLIVQVQGQRIGLEVRRIFHDAAERALAGIREKIVHAAHMEFARRSDRAFRVQVKFKGEHTGENSCELEGRTATKKTAIAADLADFVLSKVESLLDFELIQDAYLPDSLRTWISFIVLEKSSESTWSCLSAGSVRGYSGQDFQAVIDEKEKLLGHYKRQGLDAYWLLIYAPLMVGSAEDMSDEELRHIVVRTRFDRVIFLGWHCCSSLSRLPVDMAGVLEPREI